MRQVTHADNLRYFAVFLFLTLFCCSQVLQAAHFHHVHGDEPVASGLNNHVLVVAVEPSATHHHHEQTDSHGDEKEHKHRWENDWRLSRAKSVVRPGSDLVALADSAQMLPVVTFFRLRPDLKAVPLYDEYCHASKQIRGPPASAS